MVCSYPHCARYYGGCGEGCRPTKTSKKREYVILQAATVSCSGLDITIACPDYDTKDAIMQFLSAELHH